MFTSMNKYEQQNITRLKIKHFKTVLPIVKMKISTIGMWHSSMLSIIFLLIIVFLSFTALNTKLTNVNSYFVVHYVKQVCSYFVVYLAKQTTLFNVNNCYIYFDIQSILMRLKFCERISLGSKILLKVLKKITFL